MSRYNKRVDANHGEIREVFRSCGFSVLDTSNVPGFVDLVVGKDRHNYLIEIKDGAKVKSARQLTKKQEGFHAKWRGSIDIIESVEQAINFCHDKI
jgi:hypothetical protein